MAKLLPGRLEISIIVVSLNTRLISSRAGLRIALAGLLCVFGGRIEGASNSAINGACGDVSTIPSNTAPNANLCGAGTASAVSGSGPWSWTCAGSTNGSTAQCSARTPALTLANLAPGMVSTTGFGGASYALPTLAQSPVTATAGDTSEQFTAPDGQVVTVTVKSPVTTRTYQAPPMPAGENPVNYFQQQIAQAGSGATLIIPQADI